MYENSYPQKRFRITLEFLKKEVPPPQSILDLGVDNPFSKIMRQEGYNVENTEGEDLDLDFSSVENNSTEVVTAFEIFEHMLAPFNVLRKIKANKLVASVPLKLWFASAYRGENDDWDRHYHEFEAWQFNWLLEKSGWEIKACKKWTSPVNKIGFRPILRYFTPRYYIVYAERKQK